MRYSRLDLLAALELQPEQLYNGWKLLEIHPKISGDTNHGARVKVQHSACGFINPEIRFSGIQPFDCEGNKVWHGKKPSYIALAKLLSQDLKSCWRCKKVKDVNEFRQDKSNKSGLRDSCKKCEAEMRVAYSHRNPERVLLNNAKQRAKRDRLDFDLALNDIQIPETCPVLGIVLKHCFGSTTGPGDSSPTIDRIDNNKGYIKDNILIISWRANKLKGDATIGELEKVIEYLKCQPHRL